MTAMAAATRRLGQGRWVLFFALILAAWAGLMASQAGEVRGAALLWADLCGRDAANAGFPTVLAMWALMGAAMMAPTFAPALATYDDLSAAGAGTRAGFWALVAGYLSVWLGFAGAAAAAQLWLARAAPDPDGLAGGLLILAGLYQFSPWKAACLSRCRAPLTVFMAHLRPGGRSEFGIGLRMGADCLGCCWALMALALIGGAMTLLWMGLATLLMTLEKLPRIGSPVTRPLGAVLIGAGVAVIATAPGLWPMVP